MTGLARTWFPDPAWPRGVTRHLPNLSIADRKALEAEALRFELAPERAEEARRYREALAEELGR